MITGDLSPCPQLSIPEGLYEKPLPDVRRWLKSRSRDEVILERAQDGGTVTSLLVAAIREGVASTAIVVRSTERLAPYPVLTSSVKDVIEAAGSKYSHCPVLVRLMDAVRSNVKALCVVGLPCHLRALSKLKIDIDVIRIGLFCTRNFTRGLISHVAARTGVPPSRVRKLAIRRSLRVVTVDGKVFEISLGELERYVLDCCRQCPELVSHYCDVAVGGSEDEGWNSLLVISDVGEELVEKAISRGLLEVRELDRRSVSLIEELARRKSESGRRFREKVLSESEILDLIRRSG